MRTRRLIVATPEGERELLFIGRLTAGRAPECDISIADTKISRRHAEFDASGALPRVVDLGSRNGILVNGRKVGSADLANGDVVTVGDARIRFEETIVASDVRKVVSTHAEDRTAVVMSPVPVSTPPADAEPAADAPETSDRTVVLSQPPRPFVPAAPPAAEPVTSERTVVLPAPVSWPAGAAPASSSPAAPARVTSAAGSPEAVGVVGHMAHDAAMGPAADAGLPAVVAPAAANLSRGVAPSSTTPAVPAAAGVGTVSGAALRGPRFSWNGLLTLAALLLGSFAVLLGALPLMSVSSNAIDALAQRQARTLGGWLAAGVDPQSTAIVAPGVVEAVQAQPGVEQAVVLDRNTGRALAPSSVAGRTAASLPGIEQDWQTVTAPAVGRTGPLVDAYVPAGNGAYVAWVRYRPAASGDGGVAVTVALLATLVFASLVAMAVRRHTRATLQFFTRQVELAVSGASPKVMQGTLMPGLERLPGVIAYLLERRHESGRIASDGAAAGASGSGGVAVAPSVPVGPPWLEVTPSLVVAASSDHAPEGAVAWAGVPGRHLLDVLDSGPLRNAVVEGLGALGMQAGAETRVPLGDGSIVLRRESSGHVRVTLGAR